jgi:hypothetical protein
MGYGAIEHEPFVSLQALLKVVGSEERDSKFEDTGKEVELELKVLNYEESDDDEGAYIGHQFRDWFGFKKDERSGRIGVAKSSKLGNLVKATLGEEVIDNGTFEPKDLEGVRIRAQVVRSGKNEDGNYSRIKWNSIMPPRKGTSNGKKPDADLEGIDVENLDMGPDAPDFSDLRQEAS